MIKRFLNFVDNWQEFLIWLPVLVILSLAGYIVLGAFDSTITADMLGLLMELVVRCAYAACVGAGAWLFKRTYLWDLGADDEQLLHESARKGDANARWMILKDRIEWLVLLLMFGAYLWVAR